MVKLVDISKLFGLPVSMDRNSGKNPIPNDDPPLPFSQSNRKPTGQFEPLFETLRKGHPHQAGKLAEEAIGLCLDTVWKASNRLRAETTEALDDELMRACLDGLSPVYDIVEALTNNPEVSNSVGLYEGYLTISGKIDLLTRHVKSSWPDREAAWNELRRDVGELMDSMHLQRPSPSGIEVNRCREKLLEAV